MPDRCTIEIDRRLIPGEVPLEARQHVIDYLAAALGSSEAIEHEPPFLTGLGLPDENNGPLADAMLAAAREAGIESQQMGVPYGTDAAQFAAAGVPSIVFGPGSIDQAHTADEWLPLEQLAAASEALYHFARRGMK